MTVSDVSTLISGAIVVALGFWYVLASRRWTGALRARDARLAYDAMGDPGGWLGGAAYRMKAWGHAFIHPDGDPMTERLRANVRARLVIWFATAFFLLVAGGPLATFVADRARVVLAKYPTPFAVGGLVVFAFIAAFYLISLVRLIRAMGDGTTPKRLALVVSLAGICGALLGLFLFSNVDFTRT